MSKRYVLGDCLFICLCVCVCECGGHLFIHRFSSKSQVPKLKSKVQATEMRVLRMIHGVTKWDKIRNETIRQALNVESILTIIERTQLRWYGHVLRMEDSRDIKRMYNWKPTQKRPPGRPRKRWEDQIKEITHRQEPDFQKVKALAMDRKGWRGLLKRLPTDRT